MKLNPYALIKSCLFAVIVFTSTYIYAADKDPCDDLSIDIFNDLPNDQVRVYDVSVSKGSVRGDTNVTLKTQGSVAYTNVITDDSGQFVAQYKLNLCQKFKTTYKCNPNLVAIYTIHLEPQKESTDAFHHTYLCKIKTFRADNDTFSSVGVKVQPDLSQGSKIPNDRSYWRLYINGEDTSAPQNWGINKQQ